MAKKKVKKRKYTLRELWKKGFTNWKIKYRLVIRNDSTHHEKISFLLSPRNIFVVVTVSAFILVTVTAMLIAFTPLRVYVPGYTTPDEYRAYKRLAMYVDSVDAIVKRNQQFIDNFYLVINDQIEGDLSKEKVEEEKITNEKDYAKSKNAQTMEAEADDIMEKYKHNVGNSDAVPLVKRADIAAFFPKIPVNGTIIADFNAVTKHYGIDIRNKKNSPIGAIADGIVVYAGFDPLTGNTIIIQHAGNLISKYQNNDRILKKVGDKVKSEEIIATMGSSSSLEKGTHLHLELWYNGNPLNPLDYIAFY